MRDTLIIGNRIINLNEVDSTNNYLQQLIKTTNNAIEGLVVIANNQISGKGQHGNTWQSEHGKNLTFSILLKPNTSVEKQFNISKFISLSIVDFLVDLGVEHVKIKWPNDIYVANKKIAGILIENSIRQKKVVESVVGIGLNVNQDSFSSDIINPTSLKLELGGVELDIKKMMQTLLRFIDKRYVDYKTKNQAVFNSEYISKLYLLNKLRSYKINNQIIKAKIVGVSEIGRLIVDDGCVKKDYGFKEIEIVKTK